jgi:hypothetical protein
MLREQKSMSSKIARAKGSKSVRRRRFVRAKSMKIYRTAQPFYRDGKTHLWQHPNGPMRIYRMSHHLEAEREKGKRPSGLKIKKPQVALKLSFRQREKAFMTIRLPKPGPPPPECSKAGITLFQGKRQESGTEKKPSAVERLKAGVHFCKHLKL